MKRHRRDYEMMADMNLTNLLDTAFVLLITFIIASPTMRTGLNVTLPEVVNTGELKKTEPQAKPITISIKKEMADLTLPEMVYVSDEAGDIRVDLTSEASGLDSMIKAKKGLAAGKLEVIIEMDKNARYEVLAKVLAILRMHQIDSVGLPMLPESAPPPPVIPASAQKKANP